MRWMWRLVGLCTVDELDAARVDRDAAAIVLIEAHVAERLVLEAENADLRRQLTAARADHTPVTVGEYSAHAFRSSLGPHACAATVQAAHHRMVNEQLRADLRDLEERYHGGTHQSCPPVLAADPVPPIAVRYIGIPAGAPAVRR